MTLRGHYQRRGDNLSGFSNYGLGAHAGTAHSTAPPNYPNLVYETLHDVLYAYQQGWIDFNQASNVMSNTLNISNYYQAHGQILQATDTILNRDSYNSANFVKINTPPTPPPEPQIPGNAADIVNAYMLGNLTVKMAKDELEIRGYNSSQAVNFLSSAVVYQFQMNEGEHWTPTVEKLRADFGWSQTDAETALTHELSIIVGEYQMQMLAAQQTILPMDMSEPTKSDELIPGGGNVRYWSGQIEDHDWNKHSWTGTAGPTINEISYPKIAVDSMGCYGLAVSHYYADYDDETGEFFGFRKLEKGVSLPAGIPVASVMQFFVKPVKVWWPKFTLRDNFYLNSEKYPDWAKANGMKMDPNQFYLLEPELAEEGKIPIQTLEHIALGGYGAPFSNSNIIPNIITQADRERVDDSKGRTTDLPKQSAMPTFDRDFSGDKKNFFGMTVEEDKAKYAAKVEWYDGDWSGYQKYPNSIPSTNQSGKTMVIYRLPRQLDPVDDAVEIAAIAQGGPNYSLDATKKCYPYPRSEQGGYALIGRLQPGGSTNPSYAAAKHEVNIDGEIYGGRRKITLVPMISPSTHLKAGYRTGYEIGGEILQGLADWISTDQTRIEIFKTVGRFCFDTKAVGATISVTDPSKLAYFTNPNINSSYFIEGDLKPASTFFAIGQGLTNYESLDSALLTGEVHASERIIISNDGTITAGKMNDLGITSNERNPRGTTGLAGTRKYDFLVPTAVITTEDLMKGSFVAGSETIFSTFKRLTTSAEYPEGLDLTPEVFDNLVPPGNNQSEDMPTHYEVTWEGQKMLFPYSIAGFTVPDYYEGPTSEFNEDGSAVMDKVGSIGPATVTKIIFQPPFGQTITKEVEFYKELSTQKGSLLEALEDEFGEDPIDETLEVDEGRIDEEQAALDEQKYWNTRFVRTPWDQNFDFLNDDYVTGKDLVDAGYPIPGVRYEDREHGVTYDDVGGFTDEDGFVMTDETSRWGTLGKVKYTGDMSMMAVQPEIDTEKEMMDYTAMGALDWLPDAGTNTGKAVNNFIDEQKYGLDDMDVVVTTGALGGVFLFAGITAAGLAAGFALSGLGRGAGNFVGGALGA